MRLPNPKFLRDMGWSSILAGVIMLVMGYTGKLWRRVAR